ALAKKRPGRTEGGPVGTLRRRLQTMARELARGVSSFDPGIVPKTGTTLVRQWRGHTHAVLVREDGFEYEGQHYRSLTVIAERITGAHWSGPRFFGLTRRAGASVAAAGRGGSRPSTARGGAEPFDARSIPANPPKRGSSRSSIRCGRSARPARPLSTASGTKAGYACARGMMTAGAPARRWRGRLCSSCLPTSPRGGS